MDLDTLASYHKSTWRLEKRTYVQWYSYAHQLLENPARIYSTRILLQVVQPLNIP